MTHHATADHATEDHAPGARTGPLPATRAELLPMHAAARRRRNTAELGSEIWAEAAMEVERIEVEIARLERAMDPPAV